jgi:hypothetical protein
VFTNDGIRDPGVAAPEVERCAAPDNGAKVARFARNSLMPLQVS